MARPGRSLIAVAMAALVAAAGAPPAHADKPDKGKGKGHMKDAAATAAFTTEQRAAAEGWYSETYGRGTCPPGLAKKHNGCLPPGLAKKRYQVGHPLPPGTHYVPPPPELQARIGKPPEGYVYVTLDGDLLKLAAGTLLVVDAIDSLLH